MIQPQLDIRVIVLAIMIPVCAQVHAQQAPSPPPPSPELTEGLLDLLNEPVKPVPDETPSTPVPSKSSSPGAGEDLGARAESPLRPVEQSMTQLAQWLRAGSERQKTRQLQRDVVSRLDELIAQMEQQRSSSQSQDSESQPSEANNASGKNQPSPSASSARSGSERGNERRPAGSAQRAGESQTKSPDGSAPTPAADGQPASNDPSRAPAGQSGEATQGGKSPLGNRPAVVDLNTPSALQRSAWGNLPERMREQMQSRMVERFLPDFREEIEAYYRALAK